MVKRKAIKLAEVAWQVVVMFIVAFLSITVAYILSEMPPEQYATLVQLLLSFFAGYLTAKVADRD